MISFFYNSFLYIFKTDPNTQLATGLTFLNGISGIHSVVLSSSMTRPLALMESVRFCMLAPLRGLSCCSSGLDIMAVGEETVDRPAGAPAPLAFALMAAPAAMPLRRRRLSSATPSTTLGSELSEMFFFCCCWSSCDGCCTARATAHSRLRPSMLPPSPMATAAVLPMLQSLPLPLAEIDLGSGAVPEWGTEAAMLLL